MNFNSFEAGMKSPEQETLERRAVCQTTKIRITSIAIAMSRPIIQTIQELRWGSSGEPYFGQ